MAKPAGSVMERIVALCKRRGFIFQDSEIYGGINGFWDYGPLGVELKRNVREAWWQNMVRAREDMVGLETTIIMHPQVWKASGHFDMFHDMMVDCRECKSRFRADQIVCMHVCQATDETNQALTHGLDALEQFPLGKPLIQLETLLDLSVEASSLGEAVERAEERIGAAAKLHNVSELKKCRIAALESARETKKAIFAVYDKNEIPHFAIAVLLPDCEAENPRACPRCGAQNSLTEPREFNLMFKTYVGAVMDEDAVAYLRPETAQGIFLNFKNVVDSTRIKIPFGIAQIGKSFRNEITPRNFTFRSREFEQMEIEFFCHPSESNKWYEYWRDERMRWYQNLGLASSRLRLREHEKEELSHYSCGTSDIEYAFPFLAEGDFGELEGVAHRGDFDLRSHMEGKLVARDGQLVLDVGPDGKPRWKGSGKDLTYFDPDRKERYIPHVIEPSAGTDRATLAFICEAYTVDESRPSPELMKFHPRLAPIKAAVFPLVNKDGMPEIAEPIYQEIRKRWPAQYDAKASIGKRYARMDEGGTPYCFTIDGQTKQDATVTVRDRDTGQQQRIDKSRCVEYLNDQLGT